MLLCASAYQCQILEHKLFYLNNAVSCYDFICLCLFGFALTVTGIKMRSIDFTLIVPFTRYFSTSQIGVVQSLVSFKGTERMRLIGVSERCSFAEQLNCWADLTVQLIIIAICGYTLF